MSIHSHFRYSQCPLRQIPLWLSVPRVYDLTCSHNPHCLRQKTFLVLYRLLRGLRSISVNNSRPRRMRCGRQNTSGLEETSLLQFLRGCLTSTWTKTDAHDDAGGLAKVNRGAAACGSIEGMHLHSAVSVSPYALPRGMTRTQRRWSRIMQRYSSSFRVNTKECTTRAWSPTKKLGTLQPVFGQFRGTKSEESKDIMFADVGAFYN